MLLSCTATWHSAFHVLTACTPARHVRRAHQLQHRRSLSITRSESLTEGRRGLVAGKRNTLRSRHEHDSTSPRISESEMTRPDNSSLMRSSNSIAQAAAAAIAADDVPETSGRLLQCLANSETGEPLASEPSISSPQVAKVSNYLERTYSLPRRRASRGALMSEVRPGPVIHVLDLPPLMEQEMSSMSLCHPCPYGTRDLIHVLDLPPLMEQEMSSMSLCVADRT